MRFLEVLSARPNGATVRMIERRVIELTGGVRSGLVPKGAHEEFAEVSAMRRSMWEPRLLFRRPRRTSSRQSPEVGYGRIPRPSAQKPFDDVISSSPTHKTDRVLTPHPSLKPQQFLRGLVREVLPLRKGLVLDPFRGAASTVAAAETVGYQSIGMEKDIEYF